MNDQAAQKCSNGFPGIEKSGACCVSDCGTCGGSGCSSREPGLTGDDCCTKNILKQGAPCSATGHAPCFLDGKSCLRRPTSRTDAPPTSRGGLSISRSTQSPSRTQTSFLRHMPDDVAMGVLSIGAGDSTPSKSTPTESNGFVYEGCFNDRPEPDRLFSFITTMDDMTTEVSVGHVSVARGREHQGESDMPSIFRGMDM